MRGRRLDYRARRARRGSPGPVHGRLRRIEKVSCGRQRTLALEIGSGPAENSTMAHSGCRGAGAQAISAIRPEPLGGTESYSRQHLATQCAQSAVQTAHDRCVNPRRWLGGRLSLRG
jgi:hypothetical protein